MPEPAEAFMPLPSEAFMPRPAANAPDRNRTSEFQHLPNFQLPHVHARHVTAAYVPVYAAKCPVTPLHGPAECAERLNKYLLLSGPLGPNTRRYDTITMTSNRTGNRKPNWLVTVAVMTPVSLRPVSRAVETGFNETETGFT